MASSHCSNAGTSALIRSSTVDMLLGGGTVGLVAAGTERCMAVAGCGVPVEPVAEGDMAGARSTSRAGEV